MGWLLRLADEPPIAALNSNRHIGDIHSRRNRIEYDRQVTLRVYDSRHTSVVRTTDRIGQEGRILEVVVGLNRRILELIRHQNHDTSSSVHHLRRDEVEYVGRSLHTDRVVDQTRTAGLLGQGLIKHMLSIQNLQDIRRNCYTEVAVIQVVVKLNASSQLVQERNELTLQPFEVAMHEVRGRLKVEQSLEHMTALQAQVQTLVFHARADNRNLLSHCSHDVMIRKVVDHVADISLGLVRHRNFDVRTGRHGVLLEPVTIGHLNRMSVLRVLDHCIEEYLIDIFTVRGQILQNAALEVHSSRDIDLSRNFTSRSINSLVSYIQNRLTSREVRSRALLQTQGGASQRRTSSQSDMIQTHRTIDTSQRIQTSNQILILALLARSQTSLKQVSQNDLGLVNKQVRIGLARLERVDQVLGFLTRSNYHRDNVFDLNGRLIQSAGIIHTMQRRLIRNTLGDRDGRGQGVQERNGSSLVDGSDITSSRINRNSTILNQSIDKHLTNALSILLQDLAHEGIFVGNTKRLRIMRKHGLLNHFFGGIDFLCAANGRLSQAGVLISKFVDNSFNVTIFTIEQRQHFVKPLSLLYYRFSTGEFRCVLTCRSRRANAGLIVLLLTYLRNLTHLEAFSANH
nr:MAG TPA: hypothetical protein [Caudoviricetes sp.]